MNIYNKSRDIKTENVMDLLENIEEPNTCEEYMKLKKVDKFLLQLLWNKKELDTNGTFNSSDKVKQLNKPLVKYVLVARDRNTDELIGKYDSTYELAKGLKVDIDEAQYLVNHSHRVYKRSKYKSYHLIKIECDRYELKGNDYILVNWGIRANKYF